MSMGKHKLSDTLSVMGLKASDNVIIHTSFRSLMPHVHHPNDVIEQVLSCIGSHGNLMLPTFNYSRPLPEPYYDPQATSCRTGSVPECGRHRDDAVRSLHPTHSVAVIGPDAQDLTHGHLNCRAFGRGSPIDLLAQRGGKVLLLGVPQSTNSTIHIGEEYAHMPKRGVYDPMPTVKIRKPNGGMVEYQLDESPSCDSAFEVVALPLHAGGHVTHGTLGECRLQLMDGKMVIDAVVKLIADQPDALRCNNPNCDWCA
ncbi:MAG: hypothetical protein CMJ20_12330 [Phycisphaeraceae bacterium]|nr:hypothetical protein [Phycisphaeraceae bacterium]